MYCHPTVLNFYKTSSNFVIRKLLGYFDLPSLTHISLTHSYLLPLLLPCPLYIYLYLYLYLYLYALFTLVLSCSQTKEKPRSRSRPNVGYRGIVRKINNKQKLTEKFCHILNKKTKSSAFACKL